MFETLMQVYDYIQSWHLNLPAFIVIFLIGLSAFLFAAREAAGWLFKIDDLRSDLRRLQETTVALEQEIQVLQKAIHSSGHLQNPEPKPDTGSIFRLQH